MPKLKLKRTPAEERERALRHARKAAKKAAKLRPSGRDHSTHAPSPTANESDDPDGDAEYGPPPPPAPASSAFDPARVLADIEEERFRRKMRDALEEDNDVGWGRLDAMEAELNEYAHVPNRWRDGVRSQEAVDRGDGVTEPHMMGDEEYAEWIRAGMWKRTHAAEAAEQERQRAAHTARLAHEAAQREETKRLAREADEERRLRRSAKGRRKVREARASYEDRWRALLDAASNDKSEKAEELRFTDIPWPVLPGSDGVTVEDLTSERIAAFLFPTARLGMDADIHDGHAASKTKVPTHRERVRETLLRFHPDKFEGRVIGRVRTGERAAVADGVGRVARALNVLMAEAAASAD